MLLLQIKNSVKHSKFLVNRVCDYKKLNEKLKNGRIIAGNYTNTKMLITTSFFPSLNTASLIKYILGVSFLKKNIAVCIGNTSGQLKYSCSAGLIKLNKNQKVKIPLVLIKLTKIISIKLASLTSVFYSASFKQRA